MEQIITMLKSRYDITAERKSIYSDMAAFRETGFLDITTPQGKERGYSVASRTFELSELKMMIDSIQASKFLSEAKTRELIKKLETQCSKYEAQSLQRQVVVANRVKSMNTNVFHNMDAIHAAISATAQIQFKYFDFDLSKQRKYFKKGEKYTVSPWAMIYVDDNYYLLAYDAGRFKHFRVDKMDSVVESGAEREGKEAFDQIDMSAYTKYTFSMFGGGIEKVTMVFSNRMIGAVMDRFGRDVLVMKEDERHFRITVPVAVSNQFFGWVLGLGSMVTIVEPQTVRDKFVALLDKMRVRYEK
jgi:predicted DNA-binding transcriptional regulator YafY